MTGRRTSSRLRVAKWIGAVVAIACFMAACGDDGSNAAGARADRDADATEPVAGGSATVLLMNEIRSLDPVTSPAGAGADGQRMFAIYGGLVAFDAESNRAVPVLAESLLANEDHSRWTLTLREGIAFSDGSAFDAAAVRDNWKRIQDPAMRSPAIGYAATIASMTVTGPRTLEIELTAPNAHFPNSISLSAMNYIASATAIASGHDLTNDPVGAGPFLLDEWLRDSHMTLRRNPDYVDAPRPHLDQLRFRVVGDEDQRIDTFVTGDADAFYTSTPASVDRALQQITDGGFEGVTVGTGQTYLFNTSAPPFDDFRLRRAFVVGIDRDAMTDAVFGAGAVAETNFSRAGSPWFTEAGAIPGYDPVGAQALIDEVVAENGGPIKIELQSFQQSLDQQRGRFIQAAMNQYEGIEIEVTVLDSASAIGNVLQGDFQMTSWGAPYLDPEPGLYREVRSGMEGTNNSRYADPDVDRALDRARLSTDVDARAALYEEVFAALARDLPYLPYLSTTNGYVHSRRLGGVQVYEDGILRSDLLWVRS